MRFPLYSPHYGRVVEGLRGTDGDVAAETDDKKSGKCPARGHIAHAECCAPRPCAIFLIEYNYNLRNPKKDRHNIKIY